MRPIFSLLFLFAASSLLADKGQNLFTHPGQTSSHPFGTPWLTGPLLTPTSQTVAPGFWNIEPYVYCYIFPGEYGDKWEKVKRPTVYNVNFSVPIYFGITDWMDIEVLPQVNWAKTQGVSSLEFGDFVVILDFQLTREEPTNSIPGMKFYIDQTFPTGRYQKLPTEHLRTDAAGRGSFQSEVGVVIGRLIHLASNHSLNVRFNPFYNYFFSVHMKGVNAYGGARDTDGRLYPGAQIGYYFGAELTLSQNWAFALDSVGIYTMKTPFRGNPGTDPQTGLPVRMAIPPQWTFSFAPAIEYNFSEALGMIAGAWFTVAGRNTPRFVSAVLAINYYGHVPLHHPKAPTPSSL